MTTENKEKGAEKYQFSAPNGGGCGIRTHVTLPSNSFQDYLVMTASIAFRILGHFFKHPIILSYYFAFVKLFLQSLLPLSGNVYCAFGYI